jgi:Cd2+/Zn2+-exporting ATPase
MNIKIRIVLTVLCGIGAAYATFSQYVQPLPAASIIGLIAIVSGGFFTVQSTFESIKEKEIDVNVLMLIAAIGAVVLGEYADAAILLFLFSLSSTLEEIALGKTTDAIRSLMKLRPDEAIILRAEKQETVPLENVQIGEIMVVRPFDQIALDGEVVTGESSVNLSSITGESLPESVKPGSKVISGTQNLEGTLTAKVTATVGDSTIDKIVALVQTAQENKSSGEALSAWFGKWYTIAVILTFCASIVVRLLLGQGGADAFRSSLVLLVAMSPCALVISVPATTLSAMSWAARRGILVRNGRTLELLSRVNRIALDKTGTLTRGVPELSRIILHNREWHNGDPIDDDLRRVISVAAGVEAHSTHPLAKVIVDLAGQFAIEPILLESSSVIPGQGVEALTEGRVIRIGKGSFAEISESLRHKVKSLGTQVSMRDGDTEAVFLFEDQIRVQSPTVIQHLQQIGISKIAMLTGDNSASANDIASQSGITEVHANLLPQDKTQLILEYERTGERVLMVGDGVNDAPALTSATVGVAMGGLGSDVALNAADVVLMSDRLSAVPELLLLGRKCTRVIVVNLAFAGFVVLALSASSFAFKLPLPIAVLCHEGSTLLVILNGLRLLKGV